MERVCPLKQDSLCLHENLSHLAILIDALLLKPLLQYLFGSLRTEQHNCFEAVTKKKHVFQLRFSNNLIKGKIASFLTSSNNNDSNHLQSDMLI